MSPRVAALLLALVPAVGVAAAAPAPTPDPKEQEAAEALRKAGFELTVAKGDPRLRVTDAVWWHLRRAAPPTAADLARLRELPHLTSLVVCSTGEPFVLGDEAAGHLASLRGLAHLHTLKVEFRPGMLARIAEGLPGLMVLSIVFGRFPGEELDAVGKLPKLRMLALAGTDVTDDDLTLLRGAGAFPKLDTLLLDGCEKVTAGGVAALRKARPKLKIYGDPPPADRGAVR